MISGATVSTGTGQSDTTDANGAYSLGDVPVGNATVTVTAAGFTGDIQVVNVTEGVGSIANFTLDSVAVGSTVSVTDISYSTSGGKGGTKNLRVTIQLNDDQGAPVANASVSIDLYLNGNAWGSGTASTGSDRSVTFQARSAVAGFYTADVTNVSASGLTWVAGVADTGFNKP